MILLTIAIALAITIIIMIILIVKSNKLKRNLDLLERKMNSSHEVVKDLNTRISTFSRNVSDLQNKNDKFLRAFNLQSDENIRLDKKLEMIKSEISYIANKNKETCKGAIAEEPKPAKKKPYKPKKKE